MYSLNFTYQQRDRRKYSEKKRKSSTTRQTKLRMNFYAYEKLKHDHKEKTNFQIDLSIIKFSFGQSIFY